jgi:hypothetical protein
MDNEKITRSAALGWIALVIRFFKEVYDERLFTAATNELPCKILEMD